MRKSTNKTLLLFRCRLSNFLHGIRCIYLLWKLTTRRRSSSLIAGNGRTKSWLWRWSTIHTHWWLRWHLTITCTHWWMWWSLSHLIAVWILLLLNRRSGWIRVLASNIMHSTTSLCWITHIVHWRWVLTGIWIYMTWWLWLPIIIVLWCSWLLIISSVHLFYNI